MTDGEFGNMSKEDVFAWTRSFLSIRETPHYIDTRLEKLVFPVDYNIFEFQTKKLRSIGWEFANLRECQSKHSYRGQRVVEWNYNGGEEETD